VIWLLCIDHGEKNGDTTHVQNCDLMRMMSKREEERNQTTWEDIYIHTLIHRRHVRVSSSLQRLPEDLPFIYELATASGLDARKEPCRLLQQSYEFYQVSRIRGGKSIKTYGNYGRSDGRNRPHPWYLLRLDNITAFYW
jgi:hypothetical protein